MSQTTTGTITDEAIDRLRARIGVPEPWTRRPHYYRPNTDAFRIVAEAYGDDNPLYCDPAYAAATVWGGSIAPPPLVGGDSLIGEDEVTAVPDDQRELMRGDPLRGVHAFYAASAREWWAPLPPDHRVWRRNALVAVLDKPSEFAERAVHEWSANVFKDDDGTLLSGQYRLMIRTERKKAREKKKYDAIELASYTDAEIDELEAEYAAFRRRGNESRWWDDVEEGDAIGPMVKGPLTVTDMVCWHVGMGMGLYDVKALALGAANRRRIPRFFHRDDQNVPDVMQRVHWDPEWARRAGNPTTYDYGRMRETWLVHLCTDWMGDDAWLWKLECEFRGFNYVGDTHHLSGTVVRKYLAEGNRPAVDLELVAENQRGVVTTPGTATVLLPSRAHGPVRLPDPPGGARDLDTALVAISEAFLAPMSAYEGVPGLDVSLDAGVLTLRLSRPEKRNAIDDTMMYAAIDAVDLAGRDEAVRAILLTSEGEHFCSGFDFVARNQEEGRPRVGSIQRRLPAQAHRLIPLLCTVQVPVVCAVRGWAAGIGLNLALAADFTVAATDARFWAPFVDRGFTPDSGATWLLPRRVGEVRARDMILLGRVVDGAEAAEWRMIHRAVPAADVDATAAELVGTLAASATVAAGLAKWLLQTGATTALDDQLRNEAFAMELSSRSDDFREGLKAFQEKRTPEYGGR